MLIHIFTGCSNVLEILSTMQKLYNKEVCINGKCMRMEPDLNRIMESSRDEKMLNKVWSRWHGQIGTEVKPLYVSLVHMLNQGARQAGESNFMASERTCCPIPICCKYRFPMAVVF